MEPDATATASARPALIDDATRHRIGEHALDETLFVEAGAGSGKTTLLVRRIVSLVLQQGARLASIAAITFTEAAASELSSRIRAEFERQLAAAVAAGDESRAARCRQAIADSDLSAITTLHGFANRLLGEFAVAAGLPPQVRVLDEVSSQLAHEDRWLRFVDRLYEDPEHTELLQLASAVQVLVEPRWPNQASMRSVAIDFNQNWDRLQAIIDHEFEPLTSFDFAPFDAAVDELIDWQSACILTADLLAQRLADVLPGLIAIRDIDEPLRKLRILSRMSAVSPGRGGKKDAWHGGADTVAKVKQAIRDIEEAKTQVLGPVVDAVLMRLAQVVAAETYEAAQQRRLDGGLEFHDLLVLARNVLRSNRAARQALHDRYQHVLLDEFQDTDPIQIELAVLIATNADDVGGRGWHDLPVEPGRLFFVGDPKQSIYRFRRADISLFLEARDRFSGNAGPERLETNFRTVEPIVEWVNAIFASTMAAEIAGAQPEYQALAAHRKAPDDVDHRPVLLGGPHDNTKLRAAELRQIEADDVVGTIRAILADPDAWPVFDQIAETWRPAELSDITILLPTRTSLSFLRSALDDAQVRYRIVTGTLVYNTQEVSDALAALRAIDDPTDELSLVAALRSPLYACSDVDLTTWRAAGGRWDVRATAPDAVAPNHRVAQAIAHLHGLWRERWFLTPSALLERLLRERRAALLAFGDPRPSDVWRRLRFLIEQARAFEESGGDVRGFIEWAALQGGAMARVHEPMLPETDESSLSIQTIHGSKGLEFPITILSGMTTQMRGGQRGVSVLWSDDGLPSVSMKKGVQTQTHEPRADLEAAMDDYEKVRLAYVAATRARDHLIVSCHHKAGKGAAKTYGGRFWQALDDDDRLQLGRRFDWQEVVGRVEPAPLRPAQMGLALDDRPQWVADRQALLERYRTPSVLSATGIAQAALATEQRSVADVATNAPSDVLDAYRSELILDQDDDGADLPEQGPIARRRGRTGSAIGSAVHGVLQLVDLAVPHGLDDLVRQQCELHGVADKSRLVASLTNAALASDAVALAAAHDHLKELFVIAPVDGTTIEGYVDLLVHGPDGYVVVDYKTDSVRSEEDVDAKLAAYELQAAAYAVAIETVTHEPVDECRFVFCTTSGPIERRVADLPAAMERVRSTIATLGRR